MELLQELEIVQVRQKQADIDKLNGWKICNVCQEKKNIDEFYFYEKENRFCPRCNKCETIRIMKYAKPAKPRQPKILKPPKPIKERKLTEGPKKSKYKWTEDEINLLLNCVKENKTFQETASIITTRNEQSIRKKAYTLRMTFRRSPRRRFGWSEESVENLRKIAAISNMTAEELAQHLDIKLSELRYQCHANKIKIPRKIYYPRQKTSQEKTDKLKFFEVVRNKRKIFFENYLDDPENLKIAKTIDNRLQTSFQRSEQKNLEFNITAEFLMDIYKKQNGLCYYSDQKMKVLEDKVNGKNPYCISVDRINSEKGYCVGNVVLCCSYINAMKLQMLPDEFILTCGLIYKKAIKSNLD